jgi:filamentous hemagglutinin
MPKRVSSMALSAMEKQAREDVERGARLPQLRAQLLSMHWPSPQERRAYTRRFLLAHWQRYTGGQPDILEIDQQMIYYERLVLSKMSKAQAQEELSSAEEWLRQGVKTPADRAEEAREKHEHVKAGLEAQELAEQREIEEALAELERLEHEEIMKHHPVKKAAQVDLWKYPFYSRRMANIGAQIYEYKEFIPIFDEFIDLYEGFEGQTVYGEKLSGWQRALRIAPVLLELIPGAGKILSAGAKKAAKTIFYIARKTGKATKEVLKVLRNASKIPADQRKLLMEATEIMKKGGKPGKAHLDAINDAVSTLKTGQASSARRAADASADAARKGSADKAAKGAGKGADDVGKACPDCAAIDDAIPPIKRGGGGLVRITRGGKILFCNSPCKEARDVLDKLKDDMKTSLPGAASKADARKLKDINKKLAEIEAQLVKLEKAAVEKAGDKKALAEIGKKAGRVKDQAKNLDHLRKKVVNPTLATTKSVLKAAELPTTGRIRYVPPKNWNPAQPLPRGPRNGYIDRWGNEWVRGPTRTKGQAFEWDVQLSSTGKAKIGRLSPDDNMAHVNVSLDGEVTH